MISRVIFLSSVIGWSTYMLLPAPEPLPLTSSQLQAKAKQKSRSAICDRKKQTKTVRQLCKRWGEQQA
ncbi:MAG: hypothetical protein RL442_4 [Pseudomonadota bacterium]|jgi:hypothetical protein